MVCLPVFYAVPKDSKRLLSRVMFYAPTTTGLHLQRTRRMFVQNESPGKEWQEANTSSAVAVLSMVWAAVPAQAWKAG